MFCRLAENVFLEMFFRQLFIRGENNEYYC